LIQLTTGIFLLNKYFRIIITLFNQCTILPRRVEGIYNFTRNIYKLYVHKSNRQRHSNNIQIKWKQIQTCHLLFTKYWTSPFWYVTQKRWPLRKGFENIKVHLKLSFVRDKYIPGAYPGFQVRGGGAHLKKLRRAEGGAKMFGVFHVKNHDFTSKNHIFSNCGGRRENFGGARRVRPPPLGSAPAFH
jgi:hypothetical protein